MRRTIRRLLARAKLWLVREQLHSMTNRGFIDEPILSGTYGLIDRETELSRELNRLSAEGDT